MGSRAEYFFSLAKESTDFGTFNTIATALCLFVFSSAVLLLKMRRPERDKAIAQLPLDE